MFRFILYKSYSNSLLLQSKNNGIFRKFECINLVNNIRRSKLYNSCCDLQHFSNDKNVVDNKELGFTLNKTSYRRFRTHISNSIQFKSAFDMKVAADNFFKIDMVDLKSAPTPAFWMGMVGLGPMIVPGLSSFIFGFSPGLCTLQYLYCAAALSFASGIKWGTLVENKEHETWENYFLCAVPCVIAVVSLCVPRIVGYIVLISGYLVAFIIDLTTGKYPKWLIALRGVLTNISVFFLALSMIQYLIFSKF